TRLNYLDPQNVVARGYTISYKDGKIIKSISDLQEGSIIRTRFRDGYADSEVTSTNKKE
ncbi:MAG: exodeoxyribonuclease VII large subunit, partial [Bacteroidales bacterium]|nr:exodeoxyribonuclease VII large subunit [Bacteroidales bacterium]